MKVLNKKFYFYIFVFCVFNLGCKNSAVVCQYHEVIVDVPAKPMMDQNDPHAFLNMMPEDDIHKNLMPADDAHKNLMPDDDIHKNLNMADMKIDSRLAESIAPAAITWNTPEGWQEKKGSGMRLVSFANTDPKFPTETTIISLAGQAGGFSSNITRWLKQINIELPDGLTMDQFISGQEKIVNSSGMELTLVDFTKLQKNSQDQNDSILAAVIDRAESQIFIKMTGTRASILKNYDAFKALIMSISPTEIK